MSGFLAVASHTLSEALRRKLVLAVFVLIAVELLLVGALVGSAAGLVTVAGQVMQGAPGGREALATVFAGVGLAFYWPGLLLMCWLTAGFFPRMQERGAIDLLLSKPIGRVALFAGRYAGCAALAAAASVLFFGGNWIVLGLKTGLWVPAFLLTIPASIFTYLALLSMMALASLAGRFTVVSAIAATGYAAIVAPILYAASTEIGRTLMGDSAWGGVFRILYNVLPRTAETSDVLFEAIRLGRIDSPGALLQVGISAVAWFGAAAAWFRRKDY